MKLRALTLILCIGLLGLSSCKKTPKKIGNDLQPTNSLISVSFTDQQDIETSTFTVPYLSTKNLNYAFIGNMNDPVFGNSNFDFYSQYSLSTSSLNWGENAVADSVVLNLCYNGYYGDTTDKPLTMRVFEVLEEMYSDSTYKSNNTLECDATELACYSFVPRPLTPMDSTIDRGVLRIPMDISIAEKLVQNGSFATNDDFKEFFKGLHVTCDKDAIPASAVSFSLTHSYSYLRVYYHNSTDTLRYDFNVSSSDVRFNHYTHDFTTANEPIVFNAANNEKLYVQGAAGTRVWVNFPNLQEWASLQEGHVAINDARLYLTGVDTDSTELAMYAPPSKLVVAGAKFDADTSYVLLPDQLISAEYYGGEYNKTDGMVWFRITEYIQNIIQNGLYATSCNGLLIYADQGSLSPHRWSFYGPQSDSTDKKIRLEIVYSLINE